MPIAEVDWRSSARPVRIYGHLDSAPIVSAPLSSDTAVLIVRIYDLVEIQVNELVPASEREQLATHAVEQHRDWCHARFCAVARDWLSGAPRAPRTTACGQSA